MNNDSRSGNVYRSLYNLLSSIFTVQTRKILHQLSTFGNVNKQYCGSDVRQLKRIRDVRPLNVDMVVCSLNAIAFMLFTSLEQSLIQSFFVWRLYSYRDRTVDDASCCTIPWIYRHVHLCPHRRGPFSWQKQAHVSSMNAAMWCCRNCRTECCVCVNVVPDNMNFTGKFFNHRMQPKLKFTTTYD